MPSPLQAPSFANWPDTTSSSYAPAAGFQTKRESSRSIEKCDPHSWVFISATGDCLMALLGGVIAFWLRFQTSIHNFGVTDTMTLQQYGGYLWLGSASVIAILSWRGIYHRSVLLRSRWIKSQIVQGCIVWTALFLTVTLTFKFQPNISRVFVALNGLCVMVLMLGWRRLLDMLLQQPRILETLQQRTVIVGWSEDAVRLCRSFSEDAVSAINVIGWVDSSKDLFSRTVNAEVPRLGNIDNMEKLLTRHEVDMVIAADMGGSHDQIVELSNLCEREMVPFKVIPSCFRIFISGLNLETMAGTPILGVDHLPLDNSLNVVLKRTLDIVGSIVGLLLSAPIIAFFGALVYIESPGAIFYRQVRVGQNGKTFKIIKIRSMKLNAEANGKAGWSIKDDPRRLRVGSFMRKWNIDEMTQFWNVLKGEMSLVGPRPERPELILNFKHDIPHYNARHQSKPGITGWAQIKGLRGDTELTERIKCDLWYLENWNLLLDLQIMILTFFKRGNAC
ncbi:MAG: exopolysaccharide biosynthesis polyprenyl glycosylphosphotransferase [Verrucomicrobiaceae bacterium]